MAGEDDILRALLTGARVAAPPGGVGPGDDAAVLPSSALRGGSLVVTCDALEEGAHFRQGWMTWDDLAHKLLAVNLSDLAAMGAEPCGVIVAIAWPANLGPDAAHELGSALSSACGIACCPLLGGDTDVRPGPLRLEATMLGHAHRPVLRSTARAGDSLFVTGPLGGAALAVSAWLSGAPLNPNVAAESDALARFRRPRARLDASRALRDRATAMIDLSDGLLPDLRRLAEASGLAARVRVDAVPAHAALPEASRRDLALSGGEDYELLVTGPPSLQDSWPGMTPVGCLEAGEPGRIDLA